VWPRFQRESAVADAEGVMVRVLISSTYQDLIAERDTVRRVIDELVAKGHAVEALRMETFGSRATTPLEVSRHFAEIADLIVLLVGRSYGSTPPDGERSFTAEEYEVVRAFRIPCLAYIKELPCADLDQPATAFRARVRSELTCTMFDTLDALKWRVSEDLERELAMAASRIVPLELRKEVPFLVDASIFTDRRDELSELAKLLELDGARAAVVGPPGIGKTTLVQEFFRGRGRQQLLDPLWLRTDDLFGRDAFGRLRIGAPRWTREALAEALHHLVERHPRGVLVFDNVQAAPLDVAWIAARQGELRALFLSWDTMALPMPLPTIRLQSLPGADARDLLARYCSEDQRLEEEAIEDLATITGGDPLLLSLAGRRLAYTPGQTVAELAGDLRRSGEELLGLEGPTVDRGRVQVRSLLLNVYHCLEPWERSVLVALSALPSKGVSNDAMAWACAKLGVTKASRLGRAVQLGLLDARPAPDWQGHRYRFRSIVSEFLRTVDARAEGERVAGEYLLSRDALFDASADVVAEALRKQLRRTAPQLPHDGEWVEPLLVGAAPVARARALQVLRGIDDQEQVRRLVAAIEKILLKPRTERVTVALVDLLGDWRTDEVLPVLRRLWHRPEVRETGEAEDMLDREVRAAAGRALARHARMDYEVWLIDLVEHGRRVQVEAALDAAGHEKIEAALSVIEARLSDRDHRLRAVACGVLSDYDPQPALADVLWQLAEQDPDANVRNEATQTLGVWQDERALKPLFALLDSDDEDVAATAVSVLRFYRRPDVVDRLAARGRTAHEGNTRTNIAFVLCDFQDPRAAELAASLIESADGYTRRVGIHFAGMVADIPGVPDSERRVLINRLEQLLKEPDVEMRLIARAALVAFSEPSALDGLWRDVDFKTSGRTRADVARWFAISQLAAAQALLPSVKPARVRPLLGDPDPSMRSVAALVAGQLRARELIADLECLLEDESPSATSGKTVAEDASEALDRISGKRSPWVPHRRAPVAFK
jgi:HEAT repeat protein